MEPSSQFFLYLNGARRGPFSEDQVRGYVRDGLLQPADLIADHPQADWKTLGACAAFQSSAAPPEAAVATATPTSSIHADFPPLPRSALGPYARATLAPNETPFFKTSLHWIVFVRFAFLGLAVFLLLALPFAIAVQALTGSELGWFALPLPAFIMVPPTLAWVSSELVITDRRVLIKTGIIRRNTLEMFISKVESIAIEQGFLGRLCDYGTVLIRGTGGFEEPFEAIAHPLQFRNWVQRLQHGGAAGISR
ncbi:MAG: PH domain-containing protein [Chthoniobacterales bacterium]